MTAKTTVTLSCDCANACMLLALLLTCYLSTCGGGLAEGVTISRADNETVPEITIPQGRIQGINMLTHYNRTIFGFLGIPYAKPPVGDLRFKAPVAPDKWNGTFNASSDTEPCPQFDDNDVVTGNEDCLHLNAFTPQLPESDNSTLLPVMVYILGGAFKSVNNSILRFGPDLILDRDVVLVLPNFRVGVLGYLSTGDEVSPGNYGLKDIVRVLEWIQESIQNFGGDPNQVTLFGGSSGAMSVHLLALSDSTNGLIHKYITQSGTVLSSTVNRRREAAAKRAIELGEHFSCPTNTSTLLVNCLRGINASELVEAKLMFHVWQTYPVNVFSPTTEPDIEGAVITEIPANLYATGKTRDLPWISLLTRDEGVGRTIDLYDDPDLFEDFLQNIDLVLPAMLEYADVVDDVAAHTDALKSYYLNDLNANRSLLLDNVTKLAGDAQFIYPTYNAIRQHVALAKSASYFCSLEYVGSFSHSYLFTGGSVAYKYVVHGDEIMYLFKDLAGRYAPPGSEFTETDLLMVKTMVELWTSFAINGTPTTTDSVSSVVWQPYSSSLNNYLRIGDGFDTALEMKYDLHLERMQFWDELTKATTATSGEFRNPPQAFICAGKVKGPVAGQLQRMVGPVTGTISKLSH